VVLYGTVYGVVGTPLVFVQQRAPCVPAPPAQRLFARELRRFLASELQPLHVLLLCGASLEVVQEEEEVLRR
jgi:hypothetical protein